MMRGTRTDAMKRYIFSLLSIALLTISAAGASNAGDCILLCNQERETSLSACSGLPASEQQACRKASLDAYKACIETCLAASDALFVRGDANRDSGVDLADAVFVLNELFGGGDPSSCPDASDANDDGRLNIADPVAILDYLFGGADPLPPPGATAGADPTQDDPFRCFGGSAGPSPLDLILPRDTRTATFSLG